MPFTKEEIEEMKDLFIEDSYENLQSLEKQLEILEKDKNDNMALVEYYRINHSFKGMAGTTGLVEFEKFFHKNETLISAIQDKKVTINKEIIDIFYETIDVIEKDLELLKKNQSIKGTFDALIKRIEQILNVAEGGEEVQKRSRIKQMFESSGLEEFSPELLDYEDDSKKFYSITVVLVDNVRLKLARLLVVIKKVVEFGEIAQSNPPLPEILQGKIEDRINIIYQSEKTREYISQKIKNCGEIKEVQINEIDNEEVQKILNIKREMKKEIQEIKNIEASTEINSVKVNLDSLDKIVELYGEMLISSKQLEKMLDDFERPDIKEILFQMQNYMFDLQDVVLQMQLVPISSVFRIFPRMVRNLTSKNNKSINFEIKDHDVKVDRKILSDVGDIVNHLLRNACDHGIETKKERKTSNKNETGELILETKIQNNLLVLEVKDNGRGIDAEKIRKKAIEKGVYTEEELEKMSEEEIIDIIFLQNFSTSEKITNISGRGLGLNIVKEKLANIGGSISLETIKSEGTTFKIILPISRLLIKAILIRSGDQIFSIALEDIERLYQIPRSKIVVADNENYIQIVGITGADEKIKIHHLARLFNMDSEENEDIAEEIIKIVHVKKGDKSFGLTVDEFLKESEIVIKEIDDVRGEVQGISGAAILDDGSVSLIIDPFSVSI
ncbi:MAG: chemotaxis protein CheA [Promethearchaeota archaeon]